MNGYKLALLIWYAVSMIGVILYKISQVGKERVRPALDGNGTVAYIVAYVVLCVPSIWLIWNA